MENEVKVKLVTADPSALGLFGLAMATLVASSYKFGFLSGLSLVIPWIIFLGALAQLIACFNDLKLNNVFGATAFGGYGLFWFAVGMCWMIELGVFGEAIRVGIDKKAYGVGFLGYLIFSIVMTIAALETNKVLFSILVLINILLFSLMCSSFGILAAPMGLVAAISELSISILGFYGFAASLLNKHLDRPFVSVGKPFGILK